MKYLYLSISLLVFSCQQTPTAFEIPTKEMTDAEYPDNPNMESRHSEAKQRFFKTILLKNKGQYLFDLDLISHENGQCEVSLKSLPLLEMMPTAPNFIKKDEYLTYIGIINQEWNRQQVQFKVGQFLVKGNSKLQITRVDLARNCLNAYLWEMLVYAKDSDGKDKLYWQCWFDFPKEIYKDLFETKNNLSYEIFRAGLENWIDPESKKVNLEVLRKVSYEKQVAFESKNNEMYPIKGERQRKKKNIITPKIFTKTADFLSDSTKFATFSVPGYYNKLDPRKTELSKLGILKQVKKRNIIDALGRKSIELELNFLSNADNKTITKLLIGGLDFSQIPQLNEVDANNGWQTSMGIANHSFYETFDFQQAHLTKNNAFYTFLLDQKGNWLDSHKIGIDGPLFHFDEQDKSTLHLWILAFERHAFVGHYVIKI